MASAPGGPEHSYFDFAGGGIAVGEQVFWTAYWLGTVYRITPEYELVAEVVGELAWDGPPRGTLTFPLDALISASGDLFVADGDPAPPPAVVNPGPEDPNLPGIWRLTGGTVSPFSGINVAGFVDGTAGEARYGHPTGMDVNDSGTIYVADSANAAIRRVEPDGSVVTIAGGPGVLDDLGWLRPVDVAVGPDGILYVADAEANRIWAVTDAGTVSVVAGAGNPGFSDGRDTDAEFNGPLGVAVSADGVIFVADDGNQSIRKIDRGRVSTVAGIPTSGSSPVDGPGGLAGTARFVRPRDVEVGPDGRLWVSDAWTVRVVDF